MLQIVLDKYLISTDQDYCACNDRRYYLVGGSWQLNHHNDVHTPEYLHDSLLFKGLK